MKVFLGGTCNESKWREQLKPLLHIDYFDPVVSDWNEDAQKREIHERDVCDFCLYTITPKMTGVYAIAELTHDACKYPEKTLFCLLSEDGSGEFFTIGQCKSLLAVKNLVASLGVRTFSTTEDVATFLNAQG